MFQSVPLVAVSIASMEQVSYQVQQDLSAPKGPKFYHKMGFRTVTVHLYLVHEVVRLSGIWIAPQECNRGV